jgi:hypothetical protein
MFIVTGSRLRIGGQWHHCCTDQGMGFTPSSCPKESEPRLAPDQIRWLSAVRNWSLSASKPTDTRSQVV